MGPSLRAFLPVWLVMVSLAGASAYVDVMSTTSAR